MAAGAARKLAGRQGQVYITDTAASGTKTKIANLTDIKLSIKADKIDASDHDTNGWKDSLRGLMEFTGTAGFLYVTTQASRTAIFNALVNGDDVTLEFRPVDAVDEEMYSGTINFDGFDLGAGNSDAQAVNLSFYGRGALTDGTIEA
ncbi:phage tail tube protein [Terriglobus sp. ADX1]|uniref:phage tail tube protein n=1 Tax=Terriglobus sp. ADX1 TaxID=2794063 RepID=UPI002FE6023E